MKKVVRIGTVLEYRPSAGKDVPTDVFCSIKYENGNLSISGVVGPRKNGDAWGSCGQIGMSMKADDVTPATGWDAATVARFFDVWRAWHLNDMKAGCEHQTGQDWDTERKIETVEYSPTSEYHRRHDAAGAGMLSALDYAQQKALVEHVEAVCYATDRPKYPWAEVRTLISDGWVKDDKREMKAAGWVKQTEHPEGLLCKPCPVCGHKYGSAWLKAEVPQDVIAFLQALPDTDKTPAWV